jgi:hypothetical protein
LPCIVKLKSGTFHFGYFINISNQIKKANKEIEQLMKSNIFFMDLEKYDYLKPFLESIRTQSQREYIQNGVVKIFEESDIESFSYYLRQF